MANNLVDLKLLNTAYGINKKRIDNLSKKIETKEASITTLNVGTSTVTGTANVTGGTLRTDTLTVTGGLNVDGSMVASKALTLSNGGTVTGDTTLDSLTGSIKLGNASDTNGNATGSASVVVPSGKTLTLDGTATASSLTLGGSATIESSTIKNATLDGGTVNLDSKTLTINDASNGKINGSTIGSSGTTTTIQSGTVNLNSNTLTVTETSSPTGKIDGSTIGSSDSTTTIKGGTVNLNSNTLTVTSASSPTGKIDGSTIVGSSEITTNIQSGTVDLSKNTFTVKGASNGKIDGSTIGSSDSTTTIQNGTVDLNSNTLTVTKTSSPTGKITSSTISSSTIQNGTIDLSNNTLTVTSDSTITNTINGSTVTLTGVGAIDAKSMTLTTTDGASLNISNELGKTDPLSGTAVYCSGGILASKVYNAVWNDLADSIEVPQDTELEYGYCYKYKNGKVYKTDEHADPNVLGIHSDTAGMVLGIKPSHIKCINLAVAGVVLAYVDNEYECGTPLVATKEGKLTKANKMTRVLHPERIVATYFRKENNDFWGPSSNKIAVNGRSWVKIK